MQIHTYIKTLVSKGKYFFSEDEALKKTELSRIALRSALRRLKKKGEIVSLVRGFYCYVPPEYYSLGALPPDQFIDDLMKHLKLPYYVGLLSAAQYYGASHQQPQVFQVITLHPRRAIRLRRIRVIFVKKNCINKMPTRQFNTNRGFIKVATPEVLAIDLVSYPRHVGGITQGFEVLSELSEQLRLEEFKNLVHNIDKATHLQKIGYFFELLDLKEFAVICEQVLKKMHRVNKTLLDPQGNVDGAFYSERWKLIVNVDLETEI